MQGLGFTCGLNEGHRGSNGKSACILCGTECEGAVHIWHTIVVESFLQGAIRK